MELNQIIIKYGSEISCAVRFNCINMHILCRSISGSLGLIVMQAASFNSEKHFEFCI